MRASVPILYTASTLTSISCLVVMLMSAGCATTKVSNQEQLVTGPLPRPTHIWVYNFVATASDMPPDSTLAGEDDVDTAAPQSEQQIEEGRKLGAEIATQLAAQIRGMGLPAVQPAPGAQPQINDIEIRGYLLSVKEGSAAKRVIIGFGAGASELRTMVEGFQVTAQGLRKLGIGDVNSGGNKTPGAALGVATFLATHNPAGLVISTGAKVYGEASGKSTVEGRAEATAREIFTTIKPRLEAQGWIYSVPGQ